MHVALFRVDASPAMGIGHVTRSLALAESLAGGGLRIAFASHDLPPKLKDRIAARFEVHELAEGSGGAGDRAETLALAARLGARVLVLDGYHFDADYRRALSDGARVVVQIEDRPEASVVCDVFLNHHLFAEQVGYEGGGAEMLLGPRFALLRDEFRAARRGAPLPRDPAATPRLLISMGGADPVDETTKVVRAIERIATPLEARVIIGAANPRASSLREHARASSRHSIEIMNDIHNMGETIADCDVAVLAAGTTVLEAACVGIPMLVVAIADNQRPVASAAHELGIAESVGWHEDVSSQTWADAITALVRDREACERLVERQHRAVDGRGAERVADVIVGHLEK